MKSIALGVAIMFALPALPATAADVKALTGEGKQVIKAFGGALKAELTAAMKSGGPVKAVAVCNTKAPEIASAVSSDKGWTVARSSHKLRNPDNAPDDFTRQAIEEFLTRQEAGEDPTNMAKAAITEEDGKKTFRMVKAIPTASLCLNCHGNVEVKPETEEVLAKHYPEDQARGFKTGEMRGVFTLQKALDQ